MPKYLGYFERVLTDNPAGPTHAVGDDLTTVDLSLFQIWAGMAYAFPHAFAGAGQALSRAGGARGVGRGAAERRRLPRLGPAHSLQRLGIFRHYPELDYGASEGGRKRKS